MKKQHDPAEIAPPRKSPREYRVYPALIERCAQLEPVTAAVARIFEEAARAAQAERPATARVRAVEDRPTRSAS